MATRKRKVRKLRGSRTMGWGQVGQHRKSGGHGGTGNAGLHKHKWSWVLVHDPEHFGKDGFHNPTGKKIKKWINIEEINYLLEKYQPKTTRDGLPVIDLRELKIQKVLGKGNLEKPVYVIAESWTKKAEEAIVKAGGKISVN
ncbi:MAG: uL15 family ribosomal protein [Nitrososphaeria archaeon]|jgi:large subunit ribosomal protein L15|nr:50S ribosomal protein L15 [Nitrososphaerota archaeon]